MLEVGDRKDVVVLDLAYFRRRPAFRQPDAVIQQFPLRAGTLSKTVEVSLAGYGFSRAASSRSKSSSLNRVLTTECFLGPGRYLT